MQVIIIEDEALAASHLKNILNDINPKINIIVELESIEESVRWLSKNKCDLIFSDIHLSDGLCFEIFEKININIPVVFTTAYDQYSIKAFDVNSLNYILKPINREDVKKCISKYKDLFVHTQASNYNSIVKLFQQHIEIKTYQKRFIVKVGQQIKSVQTKNIAYFYSENKLVYLVTKDYFQYTLNYTLDKLEQIINPTLFFRANRQYIISIDAINKMKSYAKSKINIELHSPKNPSISISVSQNKANLFKQWLNL